MAQEVTGSFLGRGFPVITAPCGETTIDGTGTIESRMESEAPGSQSPGSVSRSRWGGMDGRAGCAVSGGEETPETVVLTVLLLSFHQGERCLYTPAEQRKCHVSFTVLCSWFHVLFGGLIMFWT